MAKYSVECPSCNTSYTIRLEGRQRDRQYKLDNWDWTCDDCQEKARQEENVKAAALNAAAGLPALTGSDKQIAWAETIRTAKIAEIDKIVDEYDSRLAKYKNDLGEMAHQDDRAKERGFTSLADAFACAKAASIQIINNTVASWWIDNRSENLGRLILKTAEQVAKARINIPDDFAAQAEATVRPAFALTETIAEVRVHEKSVEIVFPEKREDFWQIVKKQLGYIWSGSAWTRDMSIKTGLPATRAAEAGNKLLDAGFIVRIFDPAIREAAIDGDFEPECGRWIMKRASGAYNGWFCIDWKEKNEWLYNATRKLKGSKYDQKAVVVPPEQFEEVLDFAVLYGFNISTGAQELAEQSRQSRNAALVAIPAKVADHRPPVPGDKPAKLVVPKEVDINPEFKEEA